MMSDQRALEQLEEWGNDGVVRQVRRRLHNAVRSFERGNLDASLYQRLFLVQQALIDGIWWHGFRLPQIYAEVEPISGGVEMVSGGYLFHKCLVNLCLQTVYTYLPEDDVRTVPTAETWAEVVASIEKNLDTFCERTPFHAYAD